MASSPRPRLATALLGDGRPHCARGKRAVRPDSDAITPAGTPITSPLGLERLRRRGVEPGPSFRRAEAWAVGCCAVWGSRRSPSGVALARGARAVVARSAIGAKRRPLRRVLSSRDGEWRGPRGDRGRSALLIGRGSASATFFGSGLVRGRFSSACVRALVC